MPEVRDCGRVVDVDVSDVDVSDVDVSGFVDIDVVMWMCVGLR